MPIFTKKWTDKILAKEYEYILENLFFCFSALIVILIINIEKIKINPKLPEKPHSSPIVLKIKSVCCSGTKSPFVWVPWRNPLPFKPPEPIAIIDWLIL